MSFKWWCWIYVYILNKPKCIQADFEYCKQIFLCGAIYWTGKEHTHNWERISFFKKLFTACAPAIINIFYFWIVYWSNKNCNSPNFLQAEKFSSKDICQGLMAKWVPNRKIRFSGSIESADKNGFNANWISNASLYYYYLFYKYFATFDAFYLKILSSTTFGDVLHFE